ncbi:unnamed protein product [Prorocentrum cordatum]|uniref:RING-type domain-containing protein n=1 Tax=Prorocentrum cordatum TaxID=2364126 RepID=A0ABN9RLY7_9DINO|nr:unnamed protein product [Polarella glacialis]
MPPPAPAAEMAAGSCAAQPAEAEAGARDVDTGQRLLRLVPAPTLDCRVRSGRRWEAGYALSPVVENWARHVRAADQDRPAAAVGFVGATAAGKSWLVGKLQSEGGAVPRTLEENAGAGVLQSVTSDINLYADPAQHVYFVDFEGTHGTQPLELSLAGGADADVDRAVERCVGSGSWEAKRREMLRDAFQPVLAYLLCDVIIFLTREKLVCRRALEECEQFAIAANARVMCARAPALVLVQNCCRPSEGIFDPGKCTEAFWLAHLAPERSADMPWSKFFSSIDCFCVPDEFAFCKRSGFDGEEVCGEVLSGLRALVQRRILEKQVAGPQRPHSGLALSQLQWFSALSDGPVSATAAIGGGRGALESLLLQVMDSCLLPDGRVSTELFSRRLRSAVGLVARVAVRQDLADESLDQVAAYLLDLFPCGAVAPPGVERFDGRQCPIVCGQSRLDHSLHCSLHRSATLVRTVDAGWLQGLGEWLRGGITHAWPGEFVCHPDVAGTFSEDAIRGAIRKEVEEYRVERALEGVGLLPGPSWVAKAHASLRASGLQVVKDGTRRHPHVRRVRGQGLQHGLLLAAAAAPHRGAHASRLRALPRCRAVTRPRRRRGWRRDARRRARGAGPALCRLRQRPGQRWPGGARGAHRLHPCKCLVCSCCARRVGADEWPQCPLCDAPVRWMANERAVLAKGGSRVAQAEPARRSGGYGVCASR